MTYHYKIAAYGDEIDLIKMYLMPYSKDRVLKDNEIQCTFKDGKIASVYQYTRANYHGHSFLLAETVKLMSILHPHMRYRITDKNDKLSWSFDNTATNEHESNDLAMSVAHSYDAPLRFTLADIEHKIIQARAILQEISERYQKPSNGLEPLRDEIELYYHHIFMDLQEMQQYMHHRHEQLIDTLRDHGTSWNLEGSIVVNDAILAMLRESL